MSPAFGWGRTSTFPETVLLNADDGTSAYRVMSGVFRLVCPNEMIVADW